MCFVTASGETSHSVDAERTHCIMVPPTQPPLAGVAAYVLTSHARDRSRGATRGPHGDSKAKGQPPALLARRRPPPTKRPSAAAPSTITTSAWPGALHTTDRKQKSRVRAPEAGLGMGMGAATSSKPWQRRIVRADPGDAEWVGAVGGPVCAPRSCGRVGSDAGDAVGATVCHCVETNREHPSG